MSSETTPPVDATSVKNTGSWFSVVGISTIHLLAFGGLYLTVVQICWAAQDHYAAFGIAETAQFMRVHTLSDYFASYTQVFVGLMIVETIFVARCIRRRRVWASGYSHAIIFLLGFTMFVSMAWIIHPMVRFAPERASIPTGENQIDEAAISSQVDLIPLLRC